MENTNDVSYSPEQERTYSKHELDLRDKFVAEYLTDFDVEKASIRIGFHCSYAREMGMKLMQEAYVLRKIKANEVALEEPTSDEMKQRILAGLIREANYRGPGSSQSARVAALAKLASIAGMDAPSRSKMELTGADGQPLDGVFVIPGVMTPEAWAQAAAAQQEALTTKH